MLTHTYQMCPLPLMIAPESIHTCSSLLSLVITHSLIVPFHFISHLSLQSDMTGYPWYDAKLSRGEADRILKETKKVKQSCAGRTTAEPQHVGNSICASKINTPGHWAI